MSLSFRWLRLFVPLCAGWRCRPVALLSVLLLMMVLVGGCKPIQAPTSVDLTALAAVTASAAAPDGQDTCKPAHRTTFTAENLIDGDPATAWRAPGAAEGVTLEIRFAQPVKVNRLRLVPGYAKTDPCTPTIDWCPANRIPKRIQLTFDDGSRQEFMLEPQCDWQTLQWPTVTTASVTLAILETYPPVGELQRDFTPISELELWGYVP